MYLNNHAKKSEQSGQALVEIVLAISIAIIILSSLATATIAAQETFGRSERILDANLLLQKEAETVRAIKETDWDSISSPGIYHVIQSGNGWEVNAGSFTNSNTGFTRSFTVENVCRYFDGGPTNPAVSCTPLSFALPSDPSTKQITVTVSWEFFGTQSISTTFYISRYFNNTATIHTSVSDFSNGTHTSTVTTNNSGGEVELAVSTGGDWANPQVIGTEDLPGNQNANDIYVDGNTAYIVTAGGSGPELYIYDVSDPTNPSLIGSLNIGGAGFAIVVAEGYAYIANSNNNRELTIVDVTNPSAPQLVGVFNTPTNANGRGIAVAGSSAFLITDNNTNSPGFELYALNVANKSAPTQLGGLNLNATALDIYVLGDFAYIASTHNNQELQVVNITNPSSPSFVTSRDTTGNSNGQSIYALDNNLYMTDARLNIFDISTPSNPQLQISPNFPGSQRAVFALGDFIFLASTHSNSQFKVIETGNPSAEFGSANLGGNGLGVFVLGDYAFLVSANDSAEFQIIRGGVPGNPYQSSGVFESQIIDAGSQVHFNLISISKNEPAGTEIKLQIATNNDNQTWVYVGPDNTSNTYYDNSAAVPFALIIGRYFRYRAEFFGDGNSTPTLLDVGVNYSP